MPEESTRRPRRILTDWTTSAGLDGTGLLALVTGGATAEGIHLATLGYEVFVLHRDQTSADAAQVVPHVHHVVIDPADLPAQFGGRFGLVAAFDATVPVEMVAHNGLAFAVSDAAVAVSGLTQVAVEATSEGVRTVLARLA